MPPGTLLPGFCPCSLLAWNGSSKGHIVLILRVPAQHVTSEKPSLTIALEWHSTDPGSNPCRVTMAYNHFTPLSLSFFSSKRDFSTHHNGLLQGREGVCGITSMVART